MINRIHAMLHRPDLGWDPVPIQHAARYAETEWLKIDEGLVGELEARIGGLEGRRVLDLGSGPGQYSVAFARRGARVTWHDVSRTYQRIARERAEAAGVLIEFSLGYLEDAQRLSGNPFDFVFVRLAWSYCMNDRAFARLIYSLVKPGGAGYVDANTENFDETRGARRLSYLLNEWLGWKIGHPYPPRGRVANLLQRYPVICMVLDYSSPVNDKVFFVKSQVLKRGGQVPAAL